MGKIVQLPREVREKIAAGEVITAPYSVVKELIENSIDAGADKISVEIESGGKVLIRVIDNGSGIDADDLKVCAKRFTTSKISNEKDLEMIHTLGFRGEALASMAVVGELSIQSNGYAAKYNEFGEVVGDIKKSGITNGTLVELRNLFWKFPVRLNFLKSDAIETSKIIDIVKTYALFYEGISFKLKAEGEEIFGVNKESAENRVFNVLGKEVHDNVIKVDHSIEGVAVNGFISKIGYSRKTRDFQYILVNGHYVKCKPILDAVEKGYVDRLFLDRHPVAIIKLSITPSLIDVNVHPSKDELMFKNEYIIVDTVIASVRKALQSTPSVISVEPNGNLSKPTHKYEFDKGVQTLLVDEKCKISHNKPEPSTKNPILRINILGQVNRTYILGYDTEGIVLVDQHAAQERIIFEKFMSQFGKEGIKVNSLVKPFVFEVNEYEERAINQNSSFLESIGFKIEKSGRHEFALTTVPVIFGKADAVTIIRDVLDEIGSERIEYENDDIVNRIATRACRSAVKGGDLLSSAEIASIINELGSCKNPYTCPHGRPTIIRMSWGDLEKKFKRKE